MLYKTCIESPGNILFPQLRRVWVDKPKTFLTPKNGWFLILIVGFMSLIRDIMWSDSCGDLWLKSSCCGQNRQVYRPDPFQWQYVYMNQGLAHVVLSRREVLTLTWDIGTFWGTWTQLTYPLWIWPPEDSVAKPCAALEGHCVSHKAL